MTHRHAAPDLATAQALTARARTIGATLVYDIDDDLLNIPESHPEAAVLRSKAASVLHLLQHADVVLDLDGRAGHATDRDADTAAGRSERA